MTERIKRAFDLVVAGVLLVLFSPVMLAVALAVWLTSGPPVLFRHRRPGYLGKPFIMLKFRTMTEVRDAQGRVAPDAQRLTRTGQRLRNLSLDEFPQLWNVIRGDMSLVGPRPLLMEYLDRYSPEQARRHDVKPGLTGWTQVNGRNALSWDQKFLLDVWYVDHRSFFLDLKILARTFSRVIRRTGVSHESHVTMPEFMGDTEVIEARRQGTA